MLAARLLKRLGGFTLDVALDVPEGSVHVVVGESGSGKTTLLRLLAGLERPDGGSIELDGEPWFERGRMWPAAARSVGLVAQDHALFPHLSAAGNVAFGLHALRRPRAEIAERTARALERIGIAELADRPPRDLSGGQQQRVALARALVLEPRLLLLDEPLAALDVSTQRSVRVELRRLLATLACSTVYVTHSPSEALAFGDHITVLEAGRVSQHGTREQIIRHPRSRYVAEFLGVNHFRGTRVDTVPTDAPHVALPHGALRLAAAGESGEHAAIVHPREVTLALERPSGTARNVFAGVIEEIVPEPPDGELLRISVASTPPVIAQVTRAAVAALALAPGRAVYASFKAAGVTEVN